MLLTQKMLSLGAVTATDIYLDDDELDCQGDNNDHADNSPQQTILGNINLFRHY